MLRSAIFRPQAARRTCLDRAFRPCLRNASSKPSPERSKNWPPRQASSWPYFVRKRIIRLRSQRQTLYWLAPFTVFAFLCLHIETTYFYAVDVTQGISMLPTMNAAGDSVIISKRYRRGRAVQVGDMVSFDHPVDQAVQSIKRVVGLEGDWVCRDTPDIGAGTMIQIPQGHCWVVGDNLSWSRDSRLFGPLPLALIKGKVLARYKVWPSWFKLWSDFEWLENGLKPAVEDDVD